MYTNFFVKLLGEFFSTIELKLEKCDRLRWLTVLLVNSHRHIGVFEGIRSRKPIELRNDGSLCDIAPTILEILQLPQPPQMSGRSLLNVKASEKQQVLAAQTT